MNPDLNIRLQSLLSKSGVSSRRKAAEIIAGGRVKVNGEVVTEPGRRISYPNDRVTVNGKEISIDSSKTYILLNKPRGYITTLSDRFADKKVTALIDSKGKRLYPVGRLDKETEGLLLFTDDGDLTYRLLHPRYEVIREYLVKVKGRLSLKEADLLSRGIMIDGKMTNPCNIEILSCGDDNTEAVVRLAEGRKRQIRLMFKYAGHDVIELKRTAFGPLELGRLKPGDSRHLTDKEVSELRRTVK